MEYWTVPPMWTGKTVAVLASGPSMSQAVADSVKHLPRIAVNTTYELARDAEVIYACDRAWWKAHPAAFECAGLKVGIEPMRNTLPVPPYPPLVLRNGGRDGFDVRPDFLRTHNNSGAQAVQIAAHARAARILLLGFDMHGGHWHEPHSGGPKQTSPETMSRWVARFRGLHQELRRRGIDVVNCTPGSALTFIRYVPLEEAMGERAAA